MTKNNSKWWILAACLILTVSVSTLLFRLISSFNNTGSSYAYEDTPSADTEALPSLTIFHVGSRAAGGTAGGSGYLAYATSDLSNTNPWTETTELSTLPVFRNPVEYNEHLEIINADYDKMKSYLLHVADSLNLDAEQLDIEDTGYGLSAGAENIGITIRPNLTGSVYLPYESGIALPAKYDISPEASYEDNQKTAKYLRKTYKDLINMKNPKIKVGSGNFNQNNTVMFYEAAGNLTEQIVNYNFNNIYFYGNNDGTLGGVHLFQYDISQKIGDYPVISLEEAKDLLAAGSYYGGNAPNYWSGPGPMPGSVFPGFEYVQKVELLYLPSHSHNIYIPFYAFYVDSCYYVPAIDPQYITNMPVDGEFIEPLYIYAVTEENVDLGGDKFVKSEWINANPWTANAEFTTLPVFQNVVEYNEHGSITYVPYDKSEEYLYDAAKFFGYMPSNVEIENGYNYEKYTKLDGILIEVNAHMTTRISFTQGVSLPSQYDISDTASYEDKLAAAQYILETYLGLINMYSPQINITNGYNDNKSFTISFYKSETDPVEEILNYNFNRIEFHGDTEGLLSSIIIYRPYLSRKIGDIPTISIEEAKELLSAGHFYTQGADTTHNEKSDLEYTFPGLEHITHVELVYLPQSNHNIYIPYYAFYAGAMYYVPAIAPQYIANLPVNGIYPVVE